MLIEIHTELSLDAELRFINHLKEFLNEELKGDYLYHPESRVNQEAELKVEHHFTEN